MKHLKILTAFGVAVLASTSGMIQVGAATFDYFVDFSTKEVADFDDYRQTFNEDTNNLQLKYKFIFGGSYYFDSCPTNFSLNVDYRLSVLKPTTEIIQDVLLPNFLCNTIPTDYNAVVEGFLSSVYLDLLVNDDALFNEFRASLIFRPLSASVGRTLYLENYIINFDITYDFGTTYLFNYFLSDQKYKERTTTGTWTFNSTQSQYLNYVYTTAGNDTYFIRNTNLSNLGTTRKKYAIDYNEEFFRGNSVGAGFNSDFVGAADTFFVASTAVAVLNNVYEYHYLNVANLAQAIVDAPIIDFTEESCSGGFLDINVACYVNNAIAYLVNDAPVISDAFTLLNTGIELAAQTFGIIGSFSDDNVFGYLILVGFGFIAVKWFLKNDE
jgi:hypothetical protein